MPEVRIVKIRELQLGGAKLFSGRFDVVNKRGEVLGKVFPPEYESVSVMPKTANVNISTPDLLTKSPQVVNKVDSEKISPEKTTEAEVSELLNLLENPKFECVLCGNKKSEVYEDWNDETGDMVSICLDCMRSRLGEKGAKAKIRKLKKLS